MTALDPVTQALLDEAADRWLSWDEAMDLVKRLAAKVRELDAQLADARGERDHLRLAVRWLLDYFAPADEFSEIRGWDDGSYETVNVRDAVLTAMAEDDDLPYDDSNGGRWPVSDAVDRALAAPPPGVAARGEDEGR